MQANINVKKQDIKKDLKEFKKEEYPELSNSAFFVRCAVELMKIKRDRK